MIPPRFENKFPELVDANNELIASSNVRPTDNHFISVKTGQSGELAEYSVYKSIDQAVFNNKRHMLAFAGLQV